MSKRKTPVVNSPPVACPHCRGHLRATWNPSASVIRRLDCDTCDYSFDFAAYRAAARSRARADCADPAAPFPRQTVIPGAL